LKKQKTFINPDYVESEVDKMAREERERQRSVYHRKNARIRSFWLAIGFAITIIDQISKWAVTELYLRPHARLGESIDFFSWLIETPPAILSGVGFKVTSNLNIVMVWNTGVSFGMFSNLGPYMPFILIAVAIFILGFLLFWLFQTHDQTQGICCAMIIGGAIGNIIDRARFGGVIDFIDLHAFEYHWPAFNIADSAIVIGVGILILQSFVFDVKRKRRYRDRRKERAKRNLGY